MTKIHGTISILSCIYNTHYFPYTLKATPGQVVFGRDITILSGATRLWYSDRASRLGAKRYRMFLNARPNRDARSLYIIHILSCVQITARYCLFQKSEIAQQNNAHLDRLSMRRDAANYPLKYVGAFNTQFVLLLLTINIVCGGKS
jgi:hypothetical protein